MISNPKIYDNVWFMQNDKPRCLPIYQITETATNDTSDNTSILIKVGDSSNYNFFTFSEDELFRSAIELRESVFSDEEW